MNVVPLSCRWGLKRQQFKNTCFCVSRPSCALSPLIEQTRERTHELTNEITNPRTHSTHELTKSHKKSLTLCLARSLRHQARTRQTCVRRLASGSGHTVLRPRCVLPTHLGRLQHRQLGGSLGVVGRRCAQHSQESHGGVTPAGARYARLRWCCVFFFPVTNWLEGGTANSQSHNLTAGVVKGTE